MRHDRGQFSERFITPERFGQSEHFEGAEEGTALLEFSPQVERDHSRHSLGLLLVDLVLGVRWKGWVQNLKHYHKILSSPSNSIEVQFHNLCNSKCKINYSFLLTRNLIEHRTAFWLILFHQSRFFEWFDHETEAKKCIVTLLFFDIQKTQLYKARK